MTRAVLVPRSKNPGRSPGDEPREEPAGGPFGPVPAELRGVNWKGQLQASVKFRPEFKKKLDMVADDLGKSPGQLIEEFMFQVINLEHLRVIRKLKEQAEEEERQRQVRGA